MARSIWSGSITFGMVNIPVKLSLAVRPHDIRFHQVHSKDLSPVRYRKFCEAEEKEIPAGEISRAFEVSKEQFVTVSDEELDAAKPAASGDIVIHDFVEAGEILPIYYDRPYYCLPAGKSSRAYTLLFEALGRTGKVAIGRFIMHQKERLVALRPVGPVIAMSLMHFHDEVVQPDDLEERPRETKVEEKELAMARQLIDAQTGPFEPRKYQDEYVEKVRELIHAKAEGQTFKPPAAEEKPAKVLSLREALEKSLAAAQATPPKRGRKKSA